MRTIDSHKVNPCNDVIDVSVLDEPGDGGANHQYHITYPLKDGRREAQVLSFQNGPIGEVGVNGLTQEVLLAIVRDRLQGFQSGKFACRENALALTKIEEAIHWLHHRTMNRVGRGVEGTHAV